MSGADPRPSLAELRARLATVEPVFSAADRTRRGTELEILAHVPALLDIAEAALAERRLHAAYAALPRLGDSATPEQEDAVSAAFDAFHAGKMLRIAALVKVRP